MNYALIFKLIGNLLRIQAALMLFPLAVSFIYGGGDHLPFLWSILILALTGTFLTLLKPVNKNFRTKDAFATAGLAWIFMSLFGALPFYFSGYFNSFIDSAFESISAFTTTGTTILTDIEVLPHGILFWRSFSHWIGGIGVLVFMLAVMPSMNASSINLLRAESTGPLPDKIVPKIRETAKIMCIIYLVTTVVLGVLLYFAGLPVYDAVINSFSTAGTGGFSRMNGSIAAYNNVAAEIIIIIFMFLFGISFSLYFFLLGRKFLKFFKDAELKLYTGLVVAAIVIITINIYGIYGNFAEALRRSSFQVVSIASTTGFSNADVGLWPGLSQIILALLMFTGSCAGSTGGGIKLIRILLLIKATRIEFIRIFHPGSVKAVSINNKTVGQDIVSKTALFFFIYFVILFWAAVFITIEGKDMVSSVTAALSSLSNVGPGLGTAGSNGNYSSFSALSKIVLSFCMIAGRLEFLPVLVLFSPAVWKKIPRKS
ncbi:MAG: TrkH family potassium uptake protein [Oscillospiraceae bacterium]|nr:TrkH family potassium uptake protein [Oscillospiraceae bacterium]